MRDRLIELINRAKQLYKEDMAFDTIDGAKMPTETDYIIDYLLAKGVIVPPCKVGDKVYVITDCSHIMMYFDNDYLTGTEAIECPFEDVCNFTDCNDDNTQVLETYVNYMGIEDGCKWYFCCEHINRANDFNEIGKTVFLTKEEAEQKLKEWEEN